MLTRMVSVSAGLAILCLLLWACTDKRAAEPVKSEMVEQYSAGWFRLERLPACQTSWPARFTGAGESRLLSDAQYQLRDSVREWQLYIQEDGKACNRELAFLMLAAANGDLRECRSRIGCGLTEDSQLRQLFEELGQAIDLSDVLMNDYLNMRMSDSSR